LHGNKTGAIIDLTGNTYFLTAPQNLGISIKKQYLEVFGRRVPTQSANEYLPFGGQVNVCGDAYANYEALRSFIAQNKTDGFKLYYSAREGAERYILCDVESLGKTEKTMHGLLVCPVKIQPRSMWLVDRTVNTEFVGNGTAGKIYIDVGGGEYAYTYALDAGGEYAYTYSDSAFGEAALLNDGDEETSLRITINGPVVNPYLWIMDVNGNTVQSAQVNGSVLAGEKLIIDSDPERLKVALVNTAGMEIDWRGNQDYSMTTYLTLPVGEHAIKITHDNEDTVSGLIEYSMQYLGG
jgi:hypothetical protein